MRRALAVMMALGLAAGGTAAQADEPSVDCSPISCVSAHADASIDCSANGRPVEFCTGTLIYQISFDSPIPIESMNYSITASCSIDCTGAGTTTGTCGWAPPEVRPIGETGCALSDIIVVTFPANTQPGTCETYAVALALEVRTVLDPLPQTSDATTNDLTFCVD